MYKFKGIDISKWQNPKTYPYDKAKAEGFSFAILRAGSGSKKDVSFEEHYKNCRANDFQIGAYWYTYATSTTQAEAEAKLFLEAIKGKTFEYPVYLDIEDNFILQNTTKSNRNAIIQTFGRTLENEGYYFGVYTNRVWYNNYISGAKLNKSFDWWLADWRGKLPQGVNFGLWQYGGSVNPIRSASIGGVVTDQNYALRNYPEIITSRGFNGYQKENKPTKKSTDEIVKEVIAGKWGNGNDRKQRLEKAGYNYYEIQKEVNKKMGLSSTPKKSIKDIALEVVRGDWGNGLTRIYKLKKAGYNPKVVQKEVNKILKK
ncbi:MAG: GH25 family lysozyme [Clostridia bacterium]|nr:GH25 family lysozyme [Clostridia bacterium]